MTSSGTVTLTLGNIFQQLGSVGEITRTITYDANTDPVEPTSSDDDGDPASSLDLHFSGRRFHAHQVTNLAVLRIVLDVPTSNPDGSPAPSIQFYTNKATGDTGGIKAVRAGSANAEMFCNRSDIMTDGNKKYIEVSIKPLRGHSIGHLNLAFLVSKGLKALPVIIDPKIGNDG